MDEQRVRGTAEPAHIFVWLLVLYALFSVEYTYARYGWSWLPGDAARLTVASEQVYDEGTITPSRWAYPYGYTYPVLNVFLAQTLGIPIAAVQDSVQPFLVVILVPMAYAAFRALAEDRNIAAFASLLLFLQPDFLFESLRSSHAKITWVMALGMILVLVRSISWGGRLSGLLRLIPLFYLITFGLISCNSFFASSYVFGIGFAFLGGWILRRFRPAGQVSVFPVERLLYITLSCSLIFFLFYFYLYPPALRQFGTMRSILDRMATLFLEFEAQANPYRYVQITWRHPMIYVVLTTLNWVLILLSFASWLARARLLVLRQCTMSPAEWLQWLLYAAFAFLLALSVLLDFAGTLSANLQVRIFPHMMIIAIPLATDLITRFAHRMYHRGVVPYRLLSIFLALCIGFFSITSLFKVTNEPLLSNRWMFYIRGELVAIKWVQVHLRNATIWVGVDDRLVALSDVYTWGKEIAERGPQVRAGRYFLISEISRAQALRVGLPLPNMRYCLKVYDNGSANIYKNRPPTPYQR